MEISLELLIWVVLIAMLFIGAPIYLSLGVASAAVLYFSDIPLAIVVVDFLKVSDMFPLLAVVGFVFAGALMDQGGMAGQIVEVASVFMGRIRGGLGIVTILGCMFFASMIGSGPGTVAAMGSIMIPAMVKRGYSPEYAAGVSATGGTLGILIPPSNPMIVYGVVANVSVSALFMAGFVPGFIVGGCLMLTAYLHARRLGFTAAMGNDSGDSLPRMLRRNFFALMAPFVILGGIYAGICTPVEASAIAIAYSMFVGVVINRKLAWDGIWRAVKMTNITTGTVVIIISVSTVFGRFLTLYQVPQGLSALILSITDTPYIVLFFICMLLFFLGMFMETLSTIVILAPVFLPVILKLGIDPVFFGVIWVMTNEVALLSPPLGVNLFIARNMTGISLERVIKGTLPYMFVLMGIILLIMAFPPVITFLPKLVGMYK